jgi:hypothetical protein
MIRRVCGDLFRDGTANPLATDSDRVAVSRPGTTMSRSAGVTYRAINSRTWTPPSRGDDDDAGSELWQPTAAPYKQDRLRA